MKKYHDIRDVHFSGEYLILSIDGIEKKFKIEEVSSRLTTASEYERGLFEISASGYGIHWPLVDEDISIDSLLGIVHSRKKRSA